MTRISSIGSRSWGQRTRACSRGTAARTCRRSRIFRRFRRGLLKRLEALGFGGFGCNQTSVGAGLQAGPTAVSQEKNMLRRLAALAIALVALNGATLLGHDMWIEPTTFRAEPGRIIGARLRVGQDLLGDPLLRDAALINQFVADDADGR